MVGCNLSEIFAKKLCKLIGKDCFPNLVSINLNLNKIGNKGAEYICEMIEKHKLDNL